MKMCDEKIKRLFGRYHVDSGPIEAKCAGDTQ